MGSRIVALARETPDVRVVGALEAPGHAALGRDAGEVAGAGRLGVTLGADASAAITPQRVLVEFSVPAASLEHLRLVAAAGARAVIGTTGFSSAQREEIAALARRAPIMLAPNMSVAVTLAFKLLPIMAKALGDDYDVEITEIHHRFKKDAPSGTAVRMAELVAEGLGHQLGHAHGGAARRVLLEPVVDLGDLDVVVVAQRLGHDRQQLEGQRDRHRHVRR